MVRIKKIFKRNRTLLRSDIIKNFMLQISLHVGFKKKRQFVRKIEVKMFKFF